METLELFEKFLQDADGYDRTVAQYYKAGQPDTIGKKLVNLSTELAKLGATIILNLKAQAERWTHVDLSDPATLPDTTSAAFISAAWVNLDDPNDRRVTQLRMRDLERSATGSEFTRHVVYAWREWPKPPPTGGNE